MYLPDFNFYQPESIPEAIELLRRSSNVAAMAGGTDLLVDMKKGIRRHNEIVSLVKIPELKQITEGEYALFIGTCASHSEVIASPLVNKFAPALAEATSKIGSDQIRNRGTIGGNICTAASCSDSAPVLLAMNASIEIACRENLRIIPLRDFFTFNKKTILKKDEIVTRIIIPKPRFATGSCYEKFGLREAGSISVVSVAVTLTLQEDTITNACVVIGAVAPTPKICEQAGDVIKGKKINESGMGSSWLDQAGDAAVRDSIPIDDIRGGAQYRRDVLKVLTKRAASRALEIAIMNSEK